MEIIDTLSVSDWPGVTTYSMVPRPPEEITAARVDLAKLAKKIVTSDPNNVEAEELLSIYEEWSK